MQHNLKSVFIRYVPNVVQLKFSSHLTPMHMSLFSDRQIIFQTYQFKEIRHFETTEALFLFTANSTTTTQKTKRLRG